eukprot:TRINITY_DN7889_c0_g1_i1.p2 TRINITY_DN7889_c0_g1~~TRINITY_DN7889_c0_g1_i1.p2  ORF type:complete len:224 (+),score=70.04 TRINITY_DN7889_c0_g1_i1:81-752(+)
MALRICALLLLLSAAAAGSIEPFRVRFDVRIGPSGHRPSEDSYFIVEARPDWAPLGAARLRELADQSVWDDARFFRVVKGFVAQWGIPADPKVSKQWRKRRIRDDPPHPGVGNKRGYLSFATSGKNTRATQVFINLVANPSLDANFPPVGHVVEGMSVVDRLNGEYRQRPDQGKIQTEGSDYLKREFPHLSYIRRAYVVDAAGKPVDPGEEDKPVGDPVGVQA